MSKSLIVCFSQGGTTALVAESIATGLRAADWQADLCNLKDGSPPEASGYDLIGIGSPVYYYRPPFNVTDYVRSLPDLSGREAFVFVLGGTYLGDAGTQLRYTLARKGAREVGYWQCRGADYFLGYLRRGYLFSPGNPTPEELAQAERFGREVADRCAGRPYARPAADRPPAAIYRLERFALNRWLVRQMYSRLFAVDSGKCNSCGLCMKLCPTGNIAQDQDQQPVWGRDCLLCLTCELKCPRDAISSVSTWALFVLFMIYNVRHASRDPALDYTRVTHHHGRTRPV